MIFAAVLLCLSPVAIDGDTVRCGADKSGIRMFAYDSKDHMPSDALNKVKLQGLVNGGLVCELHGNSYYRTVGRCENAFGVDVSKEMIQHGTDTGEWCLYSKNYYGGCPK